LSVVSKKWGNVVA